MDLFDMKPDFDNMSKAELRAYIVAHRNDQEAFYKFVDRFKADSNDPGWHPCPKTPEDWAKVPELIQEQIKKLEK
jgi:hypothetical protein